MLLVFIANSFSMSSVLKNYNLTAIQYVIKFYVEIVKCTLKLDWNGLDMVFLFNLKWKPKQNSMLHVISAWNVNQYENFFLYQQSFNISKKVSICYSLLIQSVWLNHRVNVLFKYEIKELNIRPICVLYRKIN